jgi:hypothetical protein
LVYFDPGKGRDRENIHVAVLGLVGGGLEVLAAKEVDVCAAAVRGRECHGAGVNADARRRAGRGLLVPGGGGNVVHVDYVEARKGVGRSAGETEDYARGTEAGNIDEDA